MSETTCPDCGHTHEGANLANICVGCPCERRDLGSPDRVVHGLTPVTAPRLSPRWSQLGRCPACGSSISVDAAGVPVTDHRGGRLCRELADERAPAPQTPTEEPRP